MGWKGTERVDEWRDHAYRSTVFDNLLLYYLIVAFRNTSDTFIIIIPYLRATLLQIFEIPREGIRLLFSSLRDIFPYLRATLLQILSTKTIDAILFSKFEFDIYLITQFLFQQVIFEKFQKKRIERG